MKLLAMLVKRAALQQTTHKLPCPLNQDPNTLQLSNHSSEDTAKLDNRAENRIPWQPDPTPIHWVESVRLSTIIRLGDTTQDAIL